MDSTLKEQFLAKPDNLTALLNVAEVADLDILVDYLTDKGAGRISLDDETCARFVRAKEQGEYSGLDRGLISYEIRRFGGNTLSNLYRDARNAISFGSVLDRLLPDARGTVGYDEIVKDVAAHLKVPHNKDSDVLVLEDGILRKILRDSFEKMSDEERRALLEELNVADLSLLKPATTAALLAAGKYAGFATYKLAAIVANAVAKALLGRGLSFGATGMLMRSIKIMLGPIGWALTGLWAAADMASPAYRVTVPCVIQVAYMRQKALAQAYTATCGGCGAANELSARFCGDCGQPLAQG